jgi:hypothetical protein
MQQLMIVDSYESLVLTLRQRADEVNVSRLAIDDLSGMAAGYAGKILSLTGAKKIGPMSLFLVLPALGLRLAVVEDEDALAQIRRKTSPRDQNQVRYRHRTQSPPAE